MFIYCTRVLRLSGHAAYGRIEAARLARLLPVVLGRLADGSPTLTAVCLLAPHLTADNHEALLDAARHRSKRDIEQLVAALRPRPDVPALIRKLPQPRPPSLVASHIGAESSASVAPVPDAASSHVGEASAPIPQALVPVRPAVVQPLAPERFKVQFTVSPSTHDKLRRAQDLLRHVVPNGDPGRDHRPGPDAAAGRPREDSAGGGSPAARESGVGAARIATRARLGETRRVAARWQPMRVRGDRGPMRGARSARGPPRAPVRGRRPNGGGESGAAMPRAQRV
jgi:hypothetical protein